MDYTEVVREALEDLIDTDNIDDVIFNGDSVEVSFYDFEEFLGDVENLKEDGTSLIKALKDNIDFDIKVHISTNKEALIVKFIED